MAYSYTGDAPDARISTAYCRLRTCSAARVNASSGVSLARRTLNSRTRLVCLAFFGAPSHRLGPDPIPDWTECRIGVSDGRAGRESVRGTTFPVCARPRLDRTKCARTLLRGFLESSAHRQKIKRRPNHRCRRVTELPGRANCGTFRDTRFLLLGWGSPNLPNIHRFRIGN